MKKAISLMPFIILVAGCLNYKEFSVVDVTIESESRLVVDGKNIDIVQGYLKDDDYVGRLLRSVVGNSLGKDRSRAVILYLKANVRYYCLWAVVNALDKMGCDVYVVIGDGRNLKLMQRSGLLTGEYYLIDKREIRSFRQIETSYLFEGVSVADAAKAAIPNRQGTSLDSVDVRCSMDLPVFTFLSVLAVAQEKGYCVANLRCPLGESVADAVRDYIDGVDGL